MQQSLGFLIGATFGTVFVLANANEPLPGWAGTTLRALAVVGLLTLLFLLWRNAKSAPAGDGRPSGPSMFTRWYWVTLAVEAAAIPGGAVALKAIDAPETATVAWVAVVVGVHFIPLSIVWKQGSIMFPAIMLTVLGVVGLAVAWTSATAWTPIIAGVGSGIVLLGGCLAGTLLTRPAKA